MIPIARDRLGIPGGVGIALVVFSLYFYLDVLRPAEGRLARLDAEAASHAAEEKSRAVAMRGAAPPVSRIPEVIKQFYALAEGSGLAVERVAYQFKDRDSTWRLEVTVPLMGSYPAIRGFVGDALALTPTSSLEELSLQRSQATDPGVTAKARFSYLFEASP